MTKDLINGIYSYIDIHYQNNGIACTIYVNYVLAYLQTDKQAHNSHRLYIFPKDLNGPLTYVESRGGNHPTHLI